MAAAGAHKPVLVLGCGNVLFGDDGFGVEVARRLREHCRLPDCVEVVDAGLGVRNILFDIVLSEERPRRIILVDAVDAGRAPGEIFELDVSEMPLRKIDDFSMHQVPTSNLLKELQDLCSVEVRILAIQVESLPETVSPGISAVLESRMESACRALAGLIEEGAGA